VGGAALGGASLLAFGPDLWREVVVAQAQLGRPSLHYAAGLLAQAAWNELPLVVGAATAVWVVWRRPGLCADPALARTLTAAAGAGLALALTVLKRGSYINVLAVAEPPLLALALVGASWTIRAGANPSPRARAAVLVTGPRACCWRWSRRRCCWTPATRGRPSAPARPPGWPGRPAR
jgi:hypothetical protein